MFRINGVVYNSPETTWMNLIFDYPLWTGVLLKPMYKIGRKQYFQLFYKLEYFYVFLEYTGY